MGDVCGFEHAHQGNFWRHRSRSPSGRSLDIRFGIRSQAKVSKEKAEDRQAPPALNWRRVGKCRWRKRTSTPSVPPYTSPIRHIGAEKAYESWINRVSILHVSFLFLSMLSTNRGPTVILISSAGRGHGPASILVRLEEVHRLRPFRNGKDHCSNRQSGTQVCTCRVTAAIHTSLAGALPPGPGTSNSAANSLLSTL